MKLNKTKINLIVIIFIMALVSILFAMPVMASNEPEQIHITFVPGNWINLSGGIPMRIPHPINISWNYTGKLSFDAPMNISLNISRSGNVSYPFKYHPIFHNGDNVTLDFRNFSEQYRRGGHIILINQSQGLINIRNAIRNITKNDIEAIRNALLDRNTTQFKSLVDEKLNITINITTNHDLNKSRTFNNLKAGDYAVIVLCNNTQSDFKILSFTTFQVLESRMTLVTPHQTVVENTSIRVNVSLNQPISNVRYVAFLIHEDAFRANIDIKSDGTRPNTRLYINNINISKSIRDIFFNMTGKCLYFAPRTEIRGAIANITRENVINRRKDVEKVISNVFGKNNISIHIPKDIDDKDFDLYTLGLRRGDYILSVAAICTDRLLIGFNQTNVRIVQPQVVPVIPPVDPVRPPVDPGVRPPVRPPVDPVRPPVDPVRPPVDPVVPPVDPVVPPVDPVVPPVINVPVDPATGAAISITTLTVEKVTLTIPEGTIIRDAEGRPLATSITTLHIPEIAERIDAIDAYDFGPDGTTFSPPIDLVIAYDPADLPAGYRELDLVIRMWDGNAWVDLDTTVDTVANTATVKVSHFTIFALFAAPPVEQPVPPVVLIGAVLAIIIAIIVAIVLLKKKGKI